MRPSARARAIVASERTTTAILWIPSRTLVAVATDIEYPDLRRQRRDARRRQVRRRRLSALAVLVVLAAAALFGLVRLVSGVTAGATSVLLQPVAGVMPTTPF